MPLRARLAASLLAAAALTSACFLVPGSTLDSHMYTHFQQVGAIQMAVIEGDVGRVHSPAEWLAEHAQHPTLPATTDGTMAELRRLAAEIRTTESLSLAAGNAAAMAATCGDCHRASGMGPVMRLQSSAPEGEGTGRHMVRHLWAADRLWEGLIAPSEAMWEAGATALAESPLTVAPPDEESSEVMALAQDVHRLGAEAARAATQTERADVYGRLLVTCSRCHGLLGIGSGP